jgi:hypothetical protein
MKNLLYIFLLLVPVTVTAQTHHEFPTDSATWSYSTYGFYTNTSGKCAFVRHYGIFGDTLIRGQHYSRLLGFIQDGDSLTDSNPGFEPELATYLGAIRNDTSRKVYYLEADDSIEYELFDFGLQVGDTFSFQYINEIGYEKVTSIDSQLINNNHYRRAINFYWHRWVEGIGNWYGDFFGQLVALGFSEFNCFTDRGKQLIGVAGDCSCVKGAIVSSDLWDIVSVKKFSMDIAEPDFFPNPTSGDVLISFEKSYHKCRLSVFDINGRRIYGLSKYNTDELYFDLSQFPAGIYCVSVETEDGAIRKLLIKE